MPEITESNKAKGQGSADRDPSRDQVSELFEKRAQRHLRFLREKKPGTLLWLRRTGYSMPGFEGHWVGQLMEHDVSELLDPEFIDGWNDVFLERMRAGYHDLTDIDSDAIPTPEVYFSIGSITSMMTGKKAVFASGTGWLDANESWNELEQLRFDPDNVWVRFHLAVTQSLIDRWEGDFATVPCFYRSPLDAANGLRGNDLFYDCYDDPEKVRDLAIRCADWSLECERYMSSVLKWPEGLHRGAWNIALPDGAVFVNGDPVDLINAGQQVMFDRPSSGKLFSNTGGGFFHHHALGLRQVENVAETEGLLIQNIYSDPGIELPFMQMLKDDSVARQVIRASLKAPVHIDGDFGPWLKQLYPILRQGCFILNDHGKSWTSEMENIMSEFRETD